MSGAKIIRGLQEALAHARGDSERMMADGAALDVEFRPCGAYYPDSDHYEILTRDCATVVEHIPGSDVYFMRDMVTGEIVGMGVNFASGTFKA